MEVETKLNVLNEEYNIKYSRNPIEAIKTRLKSIDSIFGKLKRKNLPLTLESIEENLNDIAGSHIGKIYQLSQDIVDGRGKAKVGDSFWLVESKNENLKKGDKVKVTGVIDGVILEVEKYEKK